MFENIKLVVCDIDGTIKVTQNEMSQRNIRALNSLHEKGIWLALASGRTVEQVKQYPLSWGIQYPFECQIGYNGAEIWDEINQQYTAPDMLKREWIKEIVEFMDRFDSSVSIYHGNDCYINKLTRPEIESAQRNNNNLILVDDYARLYEKEVVKILYRTETVQQMAEIEEYLSHYDFENYKAVKTQKTVLEFMEKRICKSAGLKKFCTAHNISLNDVMAFGDTSNDNDMLACCVGVCLADGTDDTKAAARYITDLSCGEDGFADFVEKNLI